MSVQPQRRVTREEYLALEREAEEKHEYWDGEVVAMAGASPEHNSICFNLATVLGPQLRGTSCRGYTSDQRVREVARAGANMMVTARSQAIATGRNHIVYLATAGFADACGSVCR